MQQGKSRSYPPNMSPIMPPKPPPLPLFCWPLLLPPPIKPASKDCNPCGLLLDCSFITIALMLRNLIKDLEPPSRIMSGSGSTSRSVDEAAIRTHLKASAWSFANWANEPLFVSAVKQIILKGITHQVQASQSHVTLPQVCRDVTQAAWIHSYAQHPYKYGD